MNSNHALHILNQDSIFLYAVRGYEALSSLFYFDLTIDSLNVELHEKDYLDKNIGFQMRDQFFHGQVTKFTDLSGGSYRLRLEPEVSTLNKDQHSRIYQQQSALDIVKSLLNHFPVSFSSLTKSYSLRDYCVQYHESDWAFIERLLAEEGIRYYFVFSDNQHQLVLSDELAIRCYESTLYHPSEKEEAYLLEWIEHFKHGVNHLSSVDFNAQSPQQALQLNHYLKTNSTHYLEHKFYPGAYKVYARGEELLRYRAEAYIQDHDFILARSHYQNLKPNLLVRLAQSEADYYLITEIWHQAEGMSYRTNTHAKVPFYLNKFKAIRSPWFRAPIPPKTLIPSAQVATVVGSEAQHPAANVEAEIRLKFEWDEAQCALPARIAQSGAASPFGLQFFPRVGDKVLVYFLNGDPEQPIIWGALNDADQAALYDFHTSGIRTHNQQSFNELAFHDNSNQAAITWHAAHDFSVQVGRDSILTAQNLNIAISKGEARIEIGESYEISASDSIEFHVGKSLLKLESNKIILAASVIKLN